MNLANSQSLVRPVPMIPTNGLQTLCPTPPLMDPSAWHQWCQAISSTLQASAARPSTPSLVQARASPVPVLKQEPGQHVLPGAYQAHNHNGLVKQANYNALSRSASPANISSNSQQNLVTTAAPKASRHKYAEQRRRNRINERLDQLRTIVPHAEGTNIAGFLDTVIEYVTKLQQAVRETDKGHLVQKSGEAAEAKDTVAKPAGDSEKAESPKSALKRSKPESAAPVADNTPLVAKKQKTASEN